MMTNKPALRDVVPGANQHRPVSGEIHMPCPFCGGQDRFIITKEDRFFCRQCDHKGDAIGFVMQYESCDYKTAIQRLGMESYQAKPRLAPRPAPSPAPIRPQHHASAEWLLKAGAFASWCIDKLQANPEKLDYLAGRGISAETAGAWGLGYCPQSFERVWGTDEQGQPLKVFLPAGLVIPWYDHNMQVRRVRLRPDNPPAGQKYTSVKGGENWLYNSRKIHSASAVLLVEGEIDAISAMIGFRHRNFVAVATGGTTGARLLQWQALLAVAHTVLVAFDTDEAGEKASEFWLKQLPNAKRLKPLAHDVNDMLTQGISIQNWVVKEFATLPTPKAPDPAPQAESAPTQLPLLDAPKKAPDWGGA